MADPRAEELELLDRLSRQFAALVPWSSELGLEILSLGDGEARYRLPYATKLIGNPDTGVLHGGAITSLLDVCLGAAAFMKLPRPVPMATLDLRVDYLQPGKPGRDIVAHSTCFRATRNVAFVRGIAYHDDEADPIAAAAGTFMLATKLGHKEAR